MAALEQLRALHEEVETLEHAVVATLESKGKSTRDALLADLRVSAYLSQAQATSARLLGLYSDGDGSLREAVASMAGGGDAALASFYARLADVHEQHRGGVSSSSAAAAAATEPSASLTAGLDAAAEAALGLFTSEELYGRFVDMAPLFEEWANLPGVREARAAAAAAAASGSSAAAPPAGALNVGRVDYIGWLRDLVALHGPAAVSGRAKTSRHYRKYVSGLASYLAGFVARAHPLVDVAGDVLAPLARDFAAAVRGGGAGAGGEPADPTAPGPTPFAVEWARAAVAAATGGGGGDGAADGSSSSSDSNAAAALVDLAPFASAEALGGALSPDDVRAQLKARGLKTGGTAEERAGRLFAVRGLAPGQYPKKLLAAPAAGAAPAPKPAASTSSAASAAVAAASAPAAAAAPAESAPLYARAVVAVDPAAYAPGALAAHGILQAGAPLPAAAADSDASPLVVPAGTYASVVTALLEDVACRLAGALGDVLAATARRAERRLTRTYEELEAERAAEEANATRSGNSGVGADGAPLPPGAGGDDEDNDDDDDDNKPIYNPLNLPLGWDGKPIPYWLWKLQGLNIPYTCEVCGGATYYGRRNFDRHFQEWRHAQGMRSLGIPNTRHFHDVTSIADAQALAAKLRSELEAKAWRPDAGEEYEDSTGNVMDRRTYEDLARAGLL